MYASQHVSVLPREDVLCKFCYKVIDCNEDSVKVIYHICYVYLLQRTLQIIPLRLSTRLQSY